MAAEAKAAPEAKANAESEAKIAAEKVAAEKSAADAKVVFLANTRQYVCVCGKSCFSEFVTDLCISKAAAGRLNTHRNVQHK